MFYSKSSASDQAKIAAMTKAGQIIAQVKKDLQDYAQPGISFAQIDQKARSLIESAGAQTNFDLEPGYRWACCVNRNDGIVHGIPHPNLYVAEGDVMKIDLGCKIDGWNVDTSFSFIPGEDLQKAAPMLAHGRKALLKAIAAARVGKSIYDISAAMEKAIIKHGYQPVYQLTGHGIGRQMHESPYIPCIAQRQDKRFKLYPGQGLAIEAMYAMGSARLKEAADGWTFSTVDGSLTGYFEETVIVNESGLPTIVTNPDLQLELQKMC